VKRIVDVILSSIGLILFSFPILLIALMIRCRLGRPIFYCQMRPGLHGKPFRMFKFRTMSNELSLDGQLLPDNLRLTSFGHFLRSTSVDELPELWNVLRGDMSLVGPRPLLMEYLQHYSLEEARRHNVRPGMTGWAQVNGRNSLKWEEKFKLDIWYVDNHTLLLDFKILFLTLIKVIRCEGISASGSPTMPLFKRGNVCKEDKSQ
jgi:lipopolysaccharide/colanic/teichoic acid biosynthesis glycosyltransferase